MTGWPVPVDGIVESVVTTRTQAGTWNLAALGLHAGDPVTARTWGDTRTRRAFDRDGEGHVQFVTDPVVFVEAALAVSEVDAPVLDGVHAWARVAVERVETGETGGTRWARWALTPTETRVERRVVPTINRGRNAVVEATVAASRLDVDAYDTGTLEARLSRLEGIVDRCGGGRDRAAMARLDELVDR